jgi:hypothetical protein
MEHRGDDPDSKGQWSEGVEAITVSRLQSWCDTSRVIADITRLGFDDLAIL